MHVRSARWTVPALLLAGALALTVLHGCTETPSPTESAPAARLRPATAAAASQGQWGASYTAPIVAIHMHLLPTGKVLMWGHKGDSYLWNPASPGAGFVRVASPFEIFCSGHTLLPDGRLLAAGGNTTDSFGLAKVAIFDPALGRWTSSAPMAHARYYPSTTALPDGEVLAVGGTDEKGVMVSVPEIWNGSAWRPLTGASLVVPYYPSMFVAPNGKAFMAGPAQPSRYLSVGGTGAWTTVAKRRSSGRVYGSAVMYAPGKIMYAGGGNPPVRSAEVIDLNQPSPAWRSIAPMAYARRHMDATLLPDGEVLVTHGTSGPGSNNVAAAVHYAELWNPVTESWTTLAREPTVRVYHSTAILLPDATVLSGGSGEGGGVSYANSQFSLQLFSPPYLFNTDGSPAARPSISSAPTALAYGRTFTVQTPDAGTVARGALIRLSSVTHTFNESQLIYPLAFARSGTTALTATAPPTSVRAPPGPYLLFLVNARGVPSVARVVRVGP